MNTILTGLSFDGEDISIELNGCEFNIIISSEEFLYVARNIIKRELRKDISRIKKVIGDLK